MNVTKKLVYDSRPDAVRLTRTEKAAMILLAHAATSLDDLQKDFADRLKMIDGGAERLAETSRGTDALLNDLRMTVPENQRMSLQNTGMDYEMRLMPKLSPMTTNVIMTKEEFRTLVDCARSKCTDCTLDDNECESCKLFQLLTSVMPMDEYHHDMLCSYNLAVWGN